MPKDQFVEAEYIGCDHREEKFATGTNYRPAGPVWSEVFRPVPVPVMKNPDRFHL